MFYALLITLITVSRHFQPSQTCLSQLFPDEGGGTPILSSDLQAGGARGFGPSSQTQRDDPNAAASGSPQTRALSPVVEANVESDILKSKRVCYPDGICFTNDQQPYNGLPLPVPPVGMPLRYYLYTPEAASMEDLPVSGESVHFLDDRPLKVIVHGFGMNANHYLIIELARKLVYRCECNVIVVDWRGGSYGSYSSVITSGNFGQRSAMAFSNSRVAARILGRFLHRLYGARQTILPQFGLHCIGLDIGAHICAQLQESFHEPLARISGLNPTVPRGCGQACLDQTDAAQVDVIHTTTGGAVGTERTSVVNLGHLGADEAVGHFDFFVNWHLIFQPQCEDRDAELPQRCSSARALELFTLSIGESCYFVARSCNRPPAEAKCSPCTAPFGQCVRMGLSANKTHLLDLDVNKFNGIFFLDTLEESPYCGIDD